MSFNRNSFRPYLAGRVSPHGTGTTIEITMAMAPFVQLFMGVWLSFAALAFVGFGILVLRMPPNVDSPGIVPFLFLPFGIALCSVGFWTGATNAKRALVSLLDGTTTA